MTVNNQNLNSILDLFIDINMNTENARFEFPPEEDIDTFVRGLMHDILYKYGSKPVPTSLLRPIQSFLDSEWSQFCRYSPGPYLIAEGCAVTGLKLGLNDGRLMFQWGTAFHPRPRYASPEISICPLGYYENYDLYAIYHSNTTPELAARFGTGPDVCYWEVRLPDAMPDRTHEKALKEALQRARHANILWGSDNASPAPLGSIGTVRKMRSHA